MAAADAAAMKRTILLLLLGLGLVLAAAPGAAALGVQVGPVGFSCQGFAAFVDGTTMPPTFGVTPPTCSATLPALPA